MEQKKIKLFISVGEESAELHASRLCEELKNQCPGIELFGFGGNRMKDAGVEILYPLPDLALIGFVEVIKKLPQVARVKHLAEEIWNERKPDAILFVDFPGLHLRLAKRAHELGIPVLYYIAPQAWAWREGRVELMRRVIKKLMVIFPFEEAFFSERGVHTTYVGHPLAERFGVMEEEIPQDSYSNAVPESPLIGLLPGSRRSELRYILPSLIQAAKRLRERNPRARFLFPLASSLPEDALKRFDLPSWIEIRRDPDYRLRKEITFAWTASGTATLENALLGIPMAVVYRTGPVNIFLGRRLVRAPYIGMVNLIAQKGICAEFIQEQCHPESLARHTQTILSSPSRYQEMKDDLKTVRLRLGEKRASANAAREILDCFNAGID